MERIADELAGIRAALEAANASDPLAMLGAAMEAGSAEGAPERVKLEPKVHRLGGRNAIAMVPLASLGVDGWSIDLATNNGSLRVVLRGPSGDAVELWEAIYDESTR